MKFSAICLLIITVCGAAQAAPVVTDAYYRPDISFTGYSQFWKAPSEGEFASAGSGLGGTIQVYIQNASSSAVEVSDATLDGISLKQGVAFSDQRKFRKRGFAASIYFSKLPKEQIDKLKAAGEPVWWRFEPQTLAPGEVGELVIRLRHRPAADSVKVGIAEAEAVVKIAGQTPRMEGIRFAPGRQKVYLYVKHPQAGTAPSKVLMDGKDVTSSATISCDANTRTVPVVIELKSPVAAGSFHCFQAVYANGDKVSAGLRAFDGEFTFGVWGAQPGDANDTAGAKSYFTNLADHNMNMQMEQIGSASAQQFMKSEEGQKYMAQLGIRRMIAEPGKGGTKDPWSFFLMDEPDAGDSKVQGLPARSQVGALAQGVVDRGFELRRQSPTTPQLLNVDYTFRPDNWYTYGQVPDILTSDPYYQVRLAQDSDYGKNPDKIGPFKKANYIVGVGSICQASQAPKQLDMVLYLGTPGKEDKPFRFGTPQEKRIESYYSVGVGSKGLSYWWFSSLYEGLKPGKVDPIAAAEWKEIGLLGAEFRTAGPVIMTSCPVDIPVSAPADVWSRTLLRGSDTIVLLCVNDDYSNDPKGTNIKPVPNVEVGVDLPKWLAAKDAFEVSYKGCQDVTWNKSGQRASVKLGDLQVSRMIFITSDAGLRGRLQEIYSSKFADKVTKLLSRS